jgi:hypothetical protein
MIGFMIALALDLVPIDLPVPADTKGRLQFSLSTDKKEYLLGEPIKLTFTWKNIGARYLKLDVDRFLMRRHIRIERLDPPAEVKLIRHVYYSVGITGWPPVLGPDGEYEMKWICHTIRLKPFDPIGYYDISRPGKYRVYGKGNEQWRDAFVDVTIKAPAEEQLRAITAKDSLPSLGELGVLFKNAPRRFADVFDRVFDELWVNPHEGRGEEEASDDKARRERRASKGYVLGGIVNYLPRDRVLEYLEKIIPMEDHRHTETDLRIIYSHKSNEGSEKKR